MDSAADPLSASAPDATEIQRGQVVVGNGRGSPPGAQCQQIKANGRRCAAYAMAGRAWCFFHDPATAAARTAARQAGGRKHRAVTLPPGTPDRPLATVTDVIGFLGETINHVRRGALEPKVATAVGYLAGLLLKAFAGGRKGEVPGTDSGPVQLTFIIEAPPEAAEWLARASSPSGGMVDTSVMASTRAGSR